MLLSSGVAWRHRSLEDFRAECPDGDPALQELVWSRLDDGLVWLQSLGAPVVARETGNPRTVGVRFDPPGLTRVWSKGGWARGSGRQGTIPARHGARRSCVGRRPCHRRLRRSLSRTTAAWRSAPRRGRTAAGSRSRGAAGRRCPQARESSTAARCPRRLRSGASRTSSAPPSCTAAGRSSSTTTADRCSKGTPAWHENDLAQALGRVPSAWLVVDDADLGHQVRERTVADLVAVAEESEATFAAPAGRPPFVSSRA